MDVINETGATNHTPSQWEALTESFNLYFYFYYLFFSIEGINIT